MFSAPMELKERGEGYCESRRIHIQEMLGYGVDGLRLYGIHFPDVHLGNIRVRK